MGEEPVADAPGVADTVREATVHVTHTLELLDRLLRLPPPDAEPRPLSLKENLLLVAALDAWTTGKAGSSCGRCPTPTASLSRWHGKALR